MSDTDRPQEMRSFDEREGEGDKVAAQLRAQIARARARLSEHWAAQDDKPSHDEA